jgi:flagellar hook-length control protein FliK
MNASIVQNFAPAKSLEGRNTESKLLPTKTDSKSFNLILNKQIKSQNEKEEDDNLMVALKILIANIMNAKENLSQNSNIEDVTKELIFDSNTMEKLSEITGIENAELKEILKNIGKSGAVTEDKLINLAKNEDFKKLFDKIDLSTKMNAEKAEVENLESKIEKILDKILMKNEKKNNVPELELAEKQENVEFSDFKKIKGLGLFEEANSFNVKESESGIAVSNAAKSSSSSVSPVINMNSTNKVNEIIEIIELIKNGETKKMTVKLEPDFLGKMNIHLTENAGKISAKIFVEQEIVKHFMVANIDSIKQQLNDKGIIIDNMDFMFMGDYQNREEFREAKNGNSGHFTQGEKMRDEEGSDISNTKSTGIYA